MIIFCENHLNFSPCDLLGDSCSSQQDHLLRWQQLLRHVRARFVRLGIGFTGLELSVHRARIEREVGQWRIGGECRRRWGNEETLAPPATGRWSAVGGRGDGGDENRRAIRGGGRWWKNKVGELEANRGGGAGIDNMRGGGCGIVEARARGSPEGSGGVGEATGWQCIGGDDVREAGRR